jgi:hypothetical protein
MGGMFDIPMVLAGAGTIHSVIFSEYPRKYSQIEVRSRNLGD